MYSIIEKHFLHNKDSLVKKMKNRTKNLQDAEDIIQEAYYRALKYANTFEMGMPFNFWFSRIISNVYRDFLSERELDNVEFDEERVEGFSDAVVHKNSLDAFIEDMRTHHEREILELYFIHGFKLSEAVQITDRGYREVNNILTYFKKKSKEKYGVE